jgi:hypothetical protein
VSYLPSFDSLSFTCLNCCLWLLILICIIVFELSSHEGSLCTAIHSNLVGFKHYDLVCRQEQFHRTLLQRLWSCLHHVMIVDVLSDHFLLSIFCIKLQYHPSKVVYLGACSENMSTLTMSWTITSECCLWELMFHDLVCIDAQYILRYLLGASA